MTKHWGGNAANIAYNAALLGLTPNLMGTVGRDFADYRTWLESIGINIDAVRQIDEVFTASFFANTDLDNNQISSFYSGAMAYAKEFSIADVYAGDPDLVVISPNDTKAMSNLVHECRERSIPFVYDPSQQIARLSGEDLADGMHGAYALVVNAYEAEIIQQKTDLSIAKLQQEVEILVITQGENGLDIYHQGDKTSLPAFPVANVIDPTGAGDAFRGGLLRGLASGWPLHIAGLTGALCAAYNLEQVGTQNHSFTIAEFAERFRSHADDQGLLDTLLQVAGTHA
jgi:adenosine kinase